jgi:D-alanyl-D-alanine carboxypeptidase
MKKFLSYLIIICLICSAYPTLFTLADEVTDTQSETAVSETELVPVILPTDDVSTEDIILYSSAACVMDADTGEILYYKNMDDAHYPASITKILTALLVIENAELDEMITFSADCWDGLNYYQDMNIGILDGEQLSVEAALHAILLSSANEVCNGAAKYISGSVEAFCDLMNERAEALGCTNTHFVNPNGLQDEDHYTTAHDMALIAREAIKNPTFRKITGSYDYTVTSTNLRPEGFQLSHKHRMLMYTKYHYDACIGGKTGYTEAAKNTLVTYAEKNGITLVCVVMENSDGHIYPDTIQALDYCFDKYEKQSVSLSRTSLSEFSEQGLSLPFEGFDIQTFKYVSDTTGSILTDKETSSDSLSVQLASETVSANVAPYRTVLYPFGHMLYSAEDDSQTVGSQPLYMSLSSLQAADTPDLSGTLASSDTTDTDTIPAFIQLQTSDADTSDEPTVAAYLIGLFMRHKFAALAAAIIGFIVLTLLILWLRKILNRHKHRRNYQRLRDERIKNRLKNNQ